MNDGELIAEWNPKAAGHVLVLGFDDFVQGVTDFGEKVMPLLKCRPTTS